ncbi:hypothetical protein F4821DRAFT_68875 [Hypoxylon rubiginosum]|uniref:Uncharacterized protein n=1 Tax=Hypoxylon rubiginosum TaxID=110542 RepID=A0ACC0CIN2_9PEZI|nr:hypothetical protein F4821DRAFT_68875 [Hypoxylon rubiginosum]
MSRRGLPEALVVKDQASPSITNVNSPETLSSLIENLQGLLIKPPSIFLDTEQFRDGKVVFLHLSVPLQNTIYRIQIDGPGGVDLSTKNAAGESLSTILQSDKIPKVVFDVRGISKALFDQHNLSLDGIRDLQLMELASRDGRQSKKYVAGLAKCVETDIPASNEARKRWFESDSVDGNSSFGVLGNTLRSSMKRVKIFPTLWNIYYERLRRPGEAFWHSNSRFEAQARVKASQKPNFNVNDRGNALGPDSWWIEELRQQESDDWNDTIMMEQRAGDWELDDDAFWVRTPQEPEWEW